MHPGEFSVTADRDTDYGVPFPGEILPPERRVRARVTLPRRGSLDWAGLFDRDGARVVDLGCGNGRYLITSALARPDHLHLGIDLVPPAVQHAARRAGERGLANLKFAWGDGMRLLRHRLEPRSVDEIHVYHPQPYYDRDRTRRRMITPAFLLRAWQTLRPGGLLVVQTDNPAYRRYIEYAAPALFELQAQPGPWPDAPQGRTRREILAIQRGLPVYRVQARARDLTDEQARVAAGALGQPRFDANRERFRGGDPQPRRA